MIKATAYLPWSFKPFYGITADLVPLRGALLSSASSLGMSLQPPTAEWL